MLILSSLLVWWSAGLFRLAAADIARPDVRSCHHEYGILDRRSCETAIELLPRGALPSIFSVGQETMDNMFTLPRFEVDSAERPRCVITIDLDGHSDRNVFVLVPWNKIREMAESILDLCISSAGFGWGGTVTFGLQRTFDALVNPAPYGPDGGQVAEPAEVIQPDGSRGIVAIPAGAFGQEYGRPLEIAGMDPACTFSVPQLCRG